MRKIFVNGHGWSGSSAFIDFLNKATNPEYVVVPGEFDDFRVPGTMREVLNLASGGIPQSHRKRALKSLLKLYLRSLIDDKLLENTRFNKLITRSQALNLLSSNIIDSRNFNRVIKELRTASSVNQKKHLLTKWINNLTIDYSRQKLGAKCVFFEQFFLFDDDYSLYDWLELDHLLLFIRDPSTQLNATKESTLLYNNYPWQAQFLIGAADNIYRERQFNTFLKTTMDRYQWIQTFLNHLDNSKVTIVDFDRFLFNHEEVIGNISSRIKLSLTPSISNFDISSSIARNRSWTAPSGIDNSNISESLISAERKYAIFKSNLKHDHYFA